jgi:hypothetical protein
MSAQQVFNALLNAGVIEDTPAFSVTPYNRISSNRRTDRAQFRLWRSGKCRVQIYVGHDLSDFYSRAQAFYSACSSVAAQPLFLIRYEGNDVVGLEFAGEVNAQDAFAAGALSQSELLHNLVAANEGLGSSFEASTVEAASAELEDVFRVLRETSILSETDLAVFDAFVAPRLRSALIGPNPKTRWTNGDFLAQNIIVTNSGPKLVDYEFASRTHFYCEDWARLRLYSPSLPANVLEWVDACLGSQSEAAEIYCLIRQLILEWQVKTIPGLQSEITNIARLLVPRMDRWRLRSTPSLLLPSISDEAVSGNAQASVQVFFSPEFSFNEFRSIHTQIQEGVWSRVELPLPIAQGSWNIRLDPIHRTGISEISAVEMRDGSHTWNIPLADLEARGTCVATSVSPALTLIGYGPDSQLLLPVFRTQAPGPAWIVVWLRWERLETALGRVLETWSTSKSSEKLDNTAADRVELIASPSVTVEPSPLLAVTNSSDAFRVEALELAAQLESERVSRADAEGAHGEVSAALEEERAARAEISSSLSKLSVELAEERAASSNISARLAAASAALEEERAVRNALELTFTRQREEQRQELERLRLLSVERQRDHDQGAIEVIAKLREVEISLREAVIARERALGEVETAVRRLRQEEHDHLATRVRYEELLRSERDQAAESLRQLDATLKSTIEAKLAEEETARVCHEAFKKHMQQLAAEDQEKLKLHYEELLRERQDKEKQLEHGLRMSQARVADLENSLSWKVTSPVRRAVDLAKFNRDTRS